MAVENTDFSRSTFVYRKQQVMAWLGIEPVDNECYLDVKQSLSVLQPSLVERNLKIEDLANDINLHAEMVPGECCCGLALEYAGMPLQAQIGHRFRGKETRVIMLDTSDGVRVHCQTCNEHWPAFSTECSHYKTREPVYCHNCMHDHIRAVQDQACVGHKSVEPVSDEAEEQSAVGAVRELVTLLAKKAEPGGLIFTLVIFVSLALDALGFAKSSSPASLLIDESWLTLGLIALSVWLYSIYRDEEKVRSAKIKARAVGLFLWAGFMLLATEVMAKVITVITFIVSGMGIS
jgi:hypothetical protein